jgi:hypothetical protein
LKNIFSDTKVVDRQFFRIKPFRQKPNYPHFQNPLTRSLPSARGFSQCPDRGSATRSDVRRSPRQLVPPVRSRHTHSAFAPVPRPQPLFSFYLSCPTTNTHSQKSNALLALLALMALNAFARCPFQLPVSSF